METKVNVFCAWINKHSVFEYAIFNYGLRLGVGSGQYHRKQKSHWMA